MLQEKKKLITTIEQKKCTIYNLQLPITDLRISYLLIQIIKLQCQYCKYNYRNYLKIVLFHLHFIDIQK